MKIVRARTVQVINLCHIKAKRRTKGAKRVVRDTQVEVVSCGN